MSNIDVARLENMPMCELITMMGMVNEYLKDNSLPIYQYETEPTKERLVKDYRDSMDMIKDNMSFVTNKLNASIIYLLSEIILCNNAFDTLKGIASEVIPSLSDIKTNKELVDNYKLSEVIKDFNDKLLSIDSSLIISSHQRDILDRLREIYAILLSDEEYKTILSVIDAKILDISKDISQHQGSDSFYLKGVEAIVKSQRELIDSRLKLLTNALINDKINQETDDQVNSKTLHDNMILTTIIYVLSEYLLVNLGFDVSGSAAKAIATDCDITTNKQLFHKFSQLVRELNEKLLTINVDELQYPLQRNLISRLKDIYSVLLDKDVDEQVFSLIRAKVLDGLKYLSECDVLDTDKTFPNGFLLYAKDIFRFAHITVASEPDSDSMSQNTDLVKSVISILNVA